MAETLAQSLRTTSPPTDPTAALLRGSSIQERGKTARELTPSLLTKSAEAAGELKRSELQAESEKAGREAAALEESGRKMREETKRIRGLEQPYKEFEAPKYTAFDYAKGAATRALTAVILGGVAKTSALTQLKAIKAMQDAEKEGRQNDFLNAQLTFNEAEKKRVDFNERLKRDLDDFEKLLQTDTKTALAKAKVMTAQMQDGLVRRLIDSQRFGEAIKVARNNIETAEELEKQLTIKAAEAAARKEEKLIEAAGKGKTAGLKPGAKDVQAYVSLLVLQKDLDGIRNDLQDPELAKLVQDYRAQAFAEEEFGKTIAQLLKTEIPPKLRTFLTKIRDVRNNYYLDISGKAVTGGEAMRNYGTVPQPGDPPEVIRDKVGGMSGRVGDKISLYTQIYNLPEIQAKEGQKTGLVPGQNYQLPTEAETVYRPQTDDDFNKLPSGAIYIDPDDGKKYRKP
jgi:hypothetical protein